MRPVLAALLLGLCACGAPLERPFVPALRYAPDAADGRAPSENAPFRTVAPPLELRASWPAPKVESFTLDNGLRGLVVERHGFPIIVARLVTDLAGLEEDDPGARRASMLSSALLSPPEGIVQSAATCNASACELSSRGVAGQLGVVLANIDELATRMEPNDVLQRRIDSFWQLELKTLNWGSIGRLETGLLFGLDNRYGIATAPREPGLMELRAFRKRALAPERGLLVVVGDVTRDEVAAEAAHRFGQWQPVGQGPVALRRLGRIETYALVVHPVSSRVQIGGSVSARGPAPVNPDFVPFQVLAELLGGTMGAEAQQRVREGMTAAYAVGARVISHPEASAISIGGAFARERAVDGVRELLEAIQGLRERGPSEDALERAKQSVVGKWRTTVRTDEGLAATLAHAWVDRIPFEEALGYPAKVDRVDADAIRRVARYYLAQDVLHVAFQGDLEFIGSARALDMGTPVSVDGYGRPLYRYGPRL